MVLVTAVIPVSPKHKAAGIYQQAVQSVKNQTIPTDCILEFDDNGTGAGATRNRATANVTTPFVIWIDADDMLRPTFVEDCLKYYQQGSYVYTDWVIHGMVMNTPDCLDMWGQGQEHTITTLMPVTAWQAVGGFDETLDTLEDEDFYRKLHAYGWCGVRCPEPLIEYRRHLGASLVNKEVIDPDIQKRRVVEKHALFKNRYRSFEMAQRGCCGQNTNALSQSKIISNDPQPNDVLVEYLKHPSRIEGTVSHKFYGRLTTGQKLWMDDDDARARPDRFRIIGKNPVDVAPDVETVQKLAQQAIEREESQQQQPNYADMTRKDLLTLAESKGITVMGTGARGRILKQDLLDALA